MAQANADAPAAGQEELYFDVAQAIAAAEQDNADAPAAMDKDIVVKPLLPVPRLTCLILTPNCPTSTLLQYLTLTPGACDCDLIIEELCKRDFQDIFPYFLSLHALHRHRASLKFYLRPRLKDLPLTELKALRVYIPKISALQWDNTTHSMQAFTGPLTSMATARWDVHDWFYQLLHAQQMKGQLLFTTVALSLLPCVTLCFL